MYLIAGLSELVRPYVCSTDYAVREDSAFQVICNVPMRDSNDITSQIPSMPEAVTIKMLQQKLCAQKSHVMV